MSRLIAFTLIELLVVLAIIMLLSSMLFVLIGSASTSGEATASNALVQTVSAAIGQFTHESGAVPLPTGSAHDPESGSWYPTANDGGWEKQQLWWRLSHKMTATERVAMRQAGADADLAADPYQSADYISGKYTSSSARFAASKAIFDTIDNADAEQYRIQNTSKWEYTNASGDVHTNGRYLSYRGQYKSWILNIRGSIAKDLAERQYMTYPCLELKELGDESYVRDYTIVDAWGNPLIYVAHSTAAVEGKKTPYGRSIEAHASGRVEIIDRNADGIMNSEDWDTPPVADLLVDHNGVDGIDQSDWGSILWNARAGNSTGFFLASAGPDGLFNCLMTDVVNEDNILNDVAGN